MVTNECKKLVKSIVSVKLGSLSLHQHRISVSVIFTPYILQRPNSSRSPALFFFLPFIKLSIIKW